MKSETDPEFCVLWKTNEDEGRRWKANEEEGRSTMQIRRPLCEEEGRGRESHYGISVSVINSMESNGFLNNSGRKRLCTYIWHPHKNDLSRYLNAEYHCING